MAMIVNDQFEIRPGVFVFRQQMMRRQRWRECAGFVVLFVLSNVAAFAVWRWVDDVEARANMVSTIHICSYMFVFFALLVSIVPQTMLRLSPGGVWFARTAIGPFRWTRQRWHVSWNEVSSLKWQGASRQIVVNGRKRNLVLPERERGRDQAIARALAQYLSERFDLSQGTVNERRRRRLSAWSWKRKLADKLLLVGLVAGSFSSTLALGVFSSVPLWAVALFGWLVIHGVLIVCLVRYSRFGWEEPRK